MRHPFYFLLCSVFLFCCSEKPDETKFPAPASSSQEIIFPQENSVYIFGNMDSSSCKIDYGTDSGVLIAFLTGNRFIRIDHFMSDETVYTGRYEEERNRLLLHFDSVSVERSTVTTCEPGKETSLISIQKVNSIHIVHISAQQASRRSSSRTKYGRC